MVSSKSLMGKWRIKTLRLYISGPMSGYKHHNFPLFYEAEDTVKEAFPNAMIVNPARMDDESNQKLEYTQYLVRDIKEMLECNAILLLPHWRKSYGASLEWYVANALEFDQYEYIDGVISKKEPENVLEEADRLVYGERGDCYGHPLIDYTKTSKFWSVILGVEVTPEQAIMCMITLKLSREMNAPKRDNRVDIAGYAECLNRICSMDKQERNNMLNEANVFHGDSNETSV